MVFVCPATYPSENETRYKSHFDLFPYELSHFQKYAIEAIVEGHHAITSAPTGSGKTLSAEFAIQHLVAQGKRVFYTTPIKALSNQKYYEFTNKYPHIQVGLLTGDIKTNPDADVVIMTAEILTNMLFLLNDTFSGAEFPASAVVMDEVHYINDEHRGQTWEQTILMLPPNVQMIMLSATLDEPHKFAEWVETCKPAANPPKCVYLASTNHRIVPLYHYAYVAMTDSSLKLVKDKALEQQIRQSTNRLVKIQTDKNFFVEPGVKEIANVLTILENREVRLKRKFVLNNLVTHLKENEMLPAICFVFSRKNVEKCAEEITANLLEDDSKVPYIVRRECEQIIRRLSNYREYLELPEYNTLVALLEKGIGIHHSGMIPVLREIVELMISKKYIKLLFATESFSIGLDCPIRTAIFTNLKKYDGNQERYLFPHEYTQSAGRAGRRGIDTVGHVVHCSSLFALPTMSDYKEILCGKPQKLVSKFRIQYSMILHLIQTGKYDNFHEFAEKSMMQHEIQKQIDAQTRLIEKLRIGLDAKRAALTALRTPVETCREFLNAKSQLAKTVNKKRRECERAIRVFQDTYRYIEDDSRIIQEFDRLEAEYTNENTCLSNIRSYISEQTVRICSVLENNGYICRASSINDKSDTTVTVPESSYQFTTVGQIASHINEIHPLILSKCMVNWDHFDRFSVFQLIAFLSVFVDIKVPEETRIYEPKTKDSFVSFRIQELRDMYERYAQIEQENDIYTGISYYDVLTYDLVDDMLEWCKCDTEETCKYFLQTHIVANKGISVGDFTKACLKISAISKELSTICEKMGFVSCLHKLSSIDGYLLKYIATTQSLYV
jgi:superfamily II RNA helicase